MFWSDETAQPPHYGDGTLLDQCCRLQNLIRLSFGQVESCLSQILSEKIINCHEKGSLCHLRSWAIKITTFNLNQFWHIILFSISDRLFELSKKDCSLFLIRSKNNCSISGPFPWSWSWAYNLFFIFKSSDTKSSLKNVPVLRQGPPGHWQSLYEWTW